MQQLLMELLLLANGPLQGT